MRTFDRATDWIIGVHYTIVKCTMNDSSRTTNIEHANEHLISLPTYLPASNHDHLWHQTGTMLAGFLGYLMGLALSLGDDVRLLVPFVQVRRREPTSSRQ